MKPGSATTTLGSYELLQRSHLFSFCIQMCRCVKFEDTSTVFGFSALGTKVDVNGQTVAIFKYKGGLYAIQNACPHQAASLHLGDIEDIDGTPCISCPRHKWPYSLEDGQCLLPVDCRAECYPIRVRQERDGSEILYVGFTAISDSLFHDDSF